MSKPAWVPIAATVLAALLHGLWWLCSDAIMRDGLGVIILVPLLGAAMGLSFVAIALSRWLEPRARRSTVIANVLLVLISWGMLFARMIS